MIQSSQAWLSKAVIIPLLAIPSTSLANEGLAPVTDTGLPGHRCASVDRNAEASGEDVWECHVERDESDKQLFAKAVSAVNDPEREAQRAADAGDFRLMGYSMLVPGTFPAAYGIACNPTIVSQGYRMVRALYVGSDMPPMSTAGSIFREQEQKRHRAFGIRYNFNILNDSRSPFRTICRFVPQNHESDGFPAQR